MTASEAAIALTWRGVFWPYRVRVSGQAQASGPLHAWPPPRSQACGKVHKTLALQGADEPVHRWHRPAEIQTGRVSHGNDGLGIGGVQRAKEGVGVPGDDAERRKHVGRKSRRLNPRIVPAPASIAAART